MSKTIINFTDRKLNPEALSNFLDELSIYINELKRKNKDKDDYFKSLREKINSVQTRNNNLIDEIDSYEQENSILKSKQKEIDGMLYYWVNEYNKLKPVIENLIDDKKQKKGGGRKYKSYRKGRKSRKLYNIVTGKSYIY